MTPSVCGLFEAPLEVNVTDPVYVPEESPDAAAETTTVEAVEPLLGLTESQLPPELVETEVFNDNAEPLVVTFTFCGATEPPFAELNVNELGFSASAGFVTGGGAVTCSVMPTLCGLLDAPLAVTITVPIYVPVASPVGSAETVTSRGVVPPEGRAESQLPPEAVDTLVVKLVAAPLLVTWNVCCGGAIPLDVKLSIAGLTVSIVVIGGEAGVKV